MVGITFNEKHSYDDYGLILVSKTIGSPTTKTNTVDVVGKDGVLDLTEFFGEPKFNNRELVFEFTKVHNSFTDFYDEWSNLQNDFNGRKFEIALDEDPEFFFIGRIELEYTKERNIVTYTMTVDAEPYKIKKNKTTVVQNGSDDVVLNNLRKKVCPEITTTSETRLTFGTSIFNLSEGTWILPELELSEGENTISVETTGTVTFEYQEGGL